MAGRGDDRRLMSRSCSVRAMRSCRLRRFRMSRLSPGTPSWGCSASAQPIEFVAISTMIPSVKTVHGGDHTCGRNRRPQLQLGDIQQLRHMCHGRTGPWSNVKAARSSVRTMNPTARQPVRGWCRRRHVQVFHAGMNFGLHDIFIPGSGVLVAIIHDGGGVVPEYS